MNTLLNTLHSALLLLFLVAVPAFVADRVADARSSADTSQGVMQAGLPLDHSAPGFDIEAIPASDHIASETTGSEDVAFEVVADYEVVVTASDVSA
ncbi:MAG TPA: hypothetical protein VF594_04535 [Rubricoccaceae bacterium]|jgi:dihydroxyacetone kinase